MTSNVRTVAIFVFVYIWPVFITVRGAVPALPNTSSWRGA